MNESIPYMPSFANVQATGEPKPTAMVAECAFSWLCASLDHRSKAGREVLCCMLDKLNSNIFDVIQYFHSHAALTS